MKINNIIRKVKNYCTGTKKWELKTGHVVTPAFISGGIQYYRLNDSMNTFTERACTALKVYEEWNMRCTKEHLQLFISAMENIINNPAEIKLTELVNLINMLKERVNFILPTPDIIWKMASVAYFDDNESPYYYDDKYSKEKINKWKKDKDMSVFFCLKELKELIPYPQLSQVDLEICLAVLEKISDNQLTDIIGKVSPADQNKDFYNESKSNLNTEPIPTT
jgi:hypothetical protein